LRAYPDGKPPGNTNEFNIPIQNAAARRPAQTAGRAGVNAIRLRIASKGFIYLWLQFSAKTLRVSKNPKGLRDGQMLRLGLIFC